MNTSSRVGIYNQALGAIGVSRFVNDPEEGSNEARICKVYYEAARDQVLQDFPWGFAMRTSALQLLDKTTPGWFYTYAYPSDCLQARFISPVSAETQAELESDLIPPGYQSLNSYHEYAGRNHHISFAVVENEAGGGLGIATNKGSAVLVYTARIKTLPLWSPAAINALVWLLASKIAAPLSSNPKAAQIAGQAYEAALLKAGSLTLNEGHERPEPESEFITVRR